MKISREENTLIYTLSLSYFAQSIAGIFLDIFIFNLGDFSSVILFRCAHYCALIFIYITSGWTLKKYSSRTLIRLGLISYFFGYALLFLLGKNAINFIIPLGFILGFSSGNFWSGYNLSQYILTHEKSRSRFFGKSGSLVSFLQALGPIIGGGIIYLLTLSVSTTVGYLTVFLIVALIMLLNVFIATHLPRHSGVKFSPKDFLTYQRNQSWKTVLIHQFLNGLYDVSAPTVTGILFYLILQKEIILGAVNTASLLISALFSLWAGKLLDKNKRLYWVGGIGVALGILIFAFFQNWIGVIILTLLVYSLSPFLNISLFSSILNTIDQIKKPWEEKYHLLIERDIFLGTARIISYLVLFLLFQHNNQVTIAQNFLKIIPIIPIVLCFLLFFLYKNQKVNKNV